MEVFILIFTGYIIGSFFTGLGVYILCDTPKPKKEKSVARSRKAKKSEVKCPMLETEHPKEEPIKQEKVTLKSCSTCRFHEGGFCFSKAATTNGCGRNANYKYWEGKDEK